MFNVKSNKWENIEIDDVFPCVRDERFAFRLRPLIYTGEPCSMRPWFLLLAKALMKLITLMAPDCREPSYDRMIDGCELLLWPFLTGPSLQIDNPLSLTNSPSICATPINPSLCIWTPEHDPDILISNPPDIFTDLKTNSMYPVRFTVVEFPKNTPIISQGYLKPQADSLVAEHLTTEQLLLAVSRSLYRNCPVLAVNSSPPFDPSFPAQPYIGGITPGSAFTVVRVVYDPISGIRILAMRDLGVSPSSSNITSPPPPLRPIPNGSKPSTPTSNTRAASVVPNGVPSSTTATVAVEEEGIENECNSTNWRGCFSSNDKCSWASNPLLLSGVVEDERTYNPIQDNDDEYDGIFYMPLAAAAALFSFYFSDVPLKKGADSRANPGRFLRENSSEKKNPTEGTQLKSFTYFGDQKTHALAVRTSCVGPNPPKMASSIIDSVCTAGVQQEIKQLSTLLNNNNTKGKSRASIAASVKYLCTIKKSNLVGIEAALGPALFEKRNRKEESCKIFKAILSANDEQLPRILDLSGLIFSAPVKEQLYRMIESTSTLNEILLRGCELNDADAILIAKSVQNNPNKCIKKIFLCDNRLRSKAAEALGLMLLSNNDSVVIQEIDLGGNPLMSPDIDPSSVLEGEQYTSIGLSVLAQGLSINPSLQFVDLRRCAIDALAGQHLAEVMVSRESRGMNELIMRVAEGNLLSKAQERKMKNRI